MHTLSRAALLDTVRALFEPARGGHATPRVGLEVEMLAVSADSGAPVPAADDARGVGTARVLSSVARHAGWREEPTAYGVPRVVLPDGALITYEPGGQLEYSSSPHASLGALDSAVRSVGDLLGEAMAHEGIHLLACGVDPVTPIERALFVKDGERYTRQRAHYDRRGPDGRTMMLQSAGIHVNVDHGDDSALTWRAACALAPLLTAIFANSPTCAGNSSEWRSHRARLWRTLDPSRTTGPVGDPNDAAASYLEFALGADAFLLGDASANPLPFSAFLDAATADDFTDHLSTLFPEVRPRGYLEVRAVDALPARWCVVPAAIALAVLHHAPTRSAVLRELPPLSVGALTRAARAGLGADELFAQVTWLVPHVRAGLLALGARAAPPSVVQTVEDYFADFTLRRRDPGADAVRRFEG